MKHITIFFIIAAFLSNIHGKPPHSRIITVTDHRVETKITLSNPSSITFAYSVDDPEIEAQIKAVVQNSHSSTRNATPRSTAQGWYGGKYIRWFKIDTQRGDTSGTVEFHCTRKLIKQNVTLKNNILYLPTSPTLQKHASSKPKLPEIPFRYGVRLEVDKDGIYEISGADLKNINVPVSEIDVKTYRLFENGIEIPLHIEGQNSGALSDNESILFYGEHLRGANSHFTQYSNTNVYWLAWGETPGMRYTVSSGARRRDLTRYGSGTDTLVKRTHEFTDTIHFEKDTDIRWLGSVSQPADIASAPSIDSTLDNWYWGFIGADDLSRFKIDLPPPSANGTARLLISLTGLTSIKGEEHDHSFSILVNDNVPCEENSAKWDGQDSFIFTTDTFSVSMLKAGENSISFLKEVRGFEDRAALNWIKVIYPRSYKALDNKLEFRNNPELFNSITQYEVQGFSSREIDLLDTEKKRFFTEFEIRPGSSNGRTEYTLLFQDSTGSRSTFLAQSTSLRSKPNTLILDTIADMWDNLAGMDYIFLSADSFRTVSKPLLQAHQSRGLRCAFVSIEDVYNRFSGGIRNPESIRHFLRFLFSISPENPPRYLLLGGDTSHDLDKKNRSRNIVPTNLSRIPGWGPASDDGYLATIKGNDNFADLFVGRLPAQNREEMKSIVNKTVAYIKNPERGFWRDDILLAGGGKPGESAFTVFNDRITEEVIGPGMNILRMDADPESPYYRSEFTASKTMADHINAGIFILNFNGHGGGNIWSDSRFFSYNDLDKLHNGNWGQSGKLPIVFSFTCLTGFFESVFYRSLGEEFLRAEKHGAISFYGASAYTSQNGNLIMNRMLLREALKGSFESIGELIGYVEMLMIVEHGTNHIPLVRQYNLLGDPALPFKPTADTLALELENRVFSEDTVTLNGDAMPVGTGQARIQVLAGQQQWSSSITSVEDGKIRETLKFKENAGTSEGLVRAYAWNDSAEVRGWLPFSKDTFMIHDADVSLEKPSFGDTVDVFCRTELPAGSSDALVYCLYSISPSYEEFSADGGILMNKDSTGVYSTSESIHLSQPEDVNSVLRVKFRVVYEGAAKESGVIEFPIKGRPDLLFTTGSVQFRWERDSLALSFQILNKGSVTAPPFSILLNWINDDETESPFKEVRFGDSLHPGQTEDIFICIPDTSGSLKINAELNSNNDFRESYLYNNRSALQADISYHTLQSRSDTLISSRNGLFITPANDFSEDYDFFLFSQSISQTKPLKSNSAWVPLENDSVKAFHLGMRPALDQKDTLAWFFNSGEIDTEGKLTVLTKNRTTETWTYAGPSSQSGNHVVFHSALPGPYALASISDIKGPQIQLSVAAREIKFLDYIAKDRPFNLLISDPSGINTETVHILLNNDELASDQFSSTEHQDNPENLNITLYPPSEKKVDSLSVTAKDLAGNSTTTVFAYKPGEDLSIKFLSCHPNPFTAKPGPQGGTPRKIRFAFLLTDMANTELILYSASGRAIRNWRFSNVIGYQEIEWDGRDRNGNRIANGTYYLKLIARNDRQRVKKIIKIAKLEGYR
ncbi:MAG: C25 family cysteine peptidase [Chitinispirillaceae bacterium]